MTPTVTGYYWARAKGVKAPNHEVVWVDISRDGDSIVMRAGYDFRAEYKIKHFTDWIGPLEPPIAPG